MLSETMVASLRESLRDLVDNQDLFLDVSDIVKELSRGGNSARIERFITQKFVGHLHALSALVETSAADVNAALEALGFEESQRGIARKIREAYRPFKSEIQSAYLYDQGYLHRITGVRYRPYVFTLSGTPGVDVTLRSFDRSVLRIIDTLDSVMGLTAGLLDAITVAYSKSKIIDMPPEARTKLVTQMARASGSLERLRDDLHEGPSVGGSPALQFPSGRLIEIPEEKGASATKRRPAGRRRQTKGSSE